ncbi:MAG: hypothetical protein QOG20_5409 [Pseudonocardiales bacterium]|jgi:hypothetical protein|nr:hypothetical protein [Pseudonocardiales bacterium]MDT7709802.1 hypothetical protein [Pseudonocardiales bacterium]
MTPTLPEQGSTCRNGATWVSGHNALGGGTEPITRRATDPGHVITGVTA